MEFEGGRDLKPYLLNGLNVSVLETNLNPLYIVGVLYMCVE